MANDTQGAIEIQTPFMYTNNSECEMVTLWVDIYEYTDRRASIYIGGHNWSGTWYNYFAYCLGTSYTVRFGYDSNSNRYTIYIGETNQTWSYCTVHIRDVGTRYGRAEAMKRAWIIKKTTSIPSSGLRSDCNINNIDSSNIGSQSVNYATYARYVYCTSGNYLNFQWSGQGG